MREKGKLALTRRMAAFRAWPSAKVFVQRSFSLEQRLGFGMILVIVF